MIKKKITCNYAKNKQPKAQHVGKQQEINQQILRTFGIVGPNGNLQIPLQSIQMPIIITPPQQHTMTENSIASLNSLQRNNVNGPIIVIPTNEFSMQGRLNGIQVMMMMYLKRKGKLW